MNPTSDPASLDRLHDIVLPTAVPWWPPASGWYVVIALLAALGAWLAWRAWRYWRANAYRRAAARALAQCADLAAVAEVMRRCALAAFPREQIVRLSGEEWLAFLDRTGNTSDFSAGSARVLAEVAYAAPVPLDSGTEAAVIGAARRWIAMHRAPPQGEGQGC